MACRLSLLAPLLWTAVACDGRRGSSTAQSEPEAGAPGASQGGRRHGDDGVGGTPSSAEGEATDGGTATVTSVGGAAAGNGGAEDDGPPTQVSRFCGDAIRDPVSEECDDGPGDEEDSCSALCEATNLLAVGGDRSTRLTRRLGFGRHPLAASSSGSGVVFTEIEGSNTHLRLQRFDELGQRAGIPLPLSSDLTPGDASDPVLAALPDGRYVAAWSDLSEGSLDVVLRSVSRAGELGEPRRANTTTTGAQLAPDIIWTGEQLAVAWTDGFSVKARTFSVELEPTSAEQQLSSEMFAGDVALAAHATTWAAAFREPAPGGGEQIRVALDGGDRFHVGPFAPGPTDERPALVSLDDQHLLVVFTSGSDGVPHLEGAILDAAAPEAVVRVELDPTTPPYDSDATLEQRRPALTKVGSSVLLSWQSSSPLGDALGQELFLRELSWSSDEPQELVLSDERALGTTWTRAGTQQAPALAVAHQAQGDVLVSVFEHAALLPDSKVAPDLVFGFLPWPHVEAPMSGDGS